MRSVPVILAGMVFSASVAMAQAPSEAVGKDGYQARVVEDVDKPESPTKEQVQGNAESRSPESQSPNGQRAAPALAVPLVANPANTDQPPVQP